MVNVVQTLTQGFQNTMDKALDKITELKRPREDDGDEGEVGQRRTDKVMAMSNKRRRRTSRMMTRT